MYNERYITFINDYLYNVFEKQTYLLYVVSSIYKKSVSQFSLCLELVFVSRLYLFI